MPDAVVVGSGPNGLVAANLLADRGLGVVVLEAQPSAGGGVKTAELLEPGFRHDVFSAFYPMAAVSPAILALDLERWGLRWARGPLVLAHPATDGTCPALSPDPAETAAILDRHHAGDGERWLAVWRWWEAYGPHLVQAFFGPWPPVKGTLGLLAAARGELLELARFLTLPARQMGEELFGGAEATRLLAGCSAHTDLPPDQTLSGFPGLLLLLIGQQVGWPTPVGGAGALTDALLARLEAKGGVVRCSAPVERVVVDRGRCTGVRLAGGEEVHAAVVVADVGAEQLYLRLLDEADVPAATLRRIRRFTRSRGTVKVDWTLDGPIPWEAEDARRSGTVHIADSTDRIADTGHALSQGRVPDDPFTLFGQYSVLDQTRMPHGKEVAWAYWHEPYDVPFDPDRAADLVEARVERLAPGFRDLVRRRHVMGPADLQAANANLEGGMVGGGTVALHQMLVFRPVPTLRPHATPVAGLFLGSDSTHPGGGVHGACGGMAARSALRHLALRGRARPLLPGRWT